jgi:D-lactate dehydrogenase (cytochrome)
LTTGNLFSEDVLYYQKEASAQDLEIVIFGHVPENRIHVNIISNSYEEYEKGKKLLEAWYKRALESGGTVFREHGVGKVKRDLFKRVVREEVLKRITADKKALDPQNLLNPGNKLF